MDGTRVFLRNLVDWEVRHIDVRAKTRLEGSTDSTQLIPNDTSEEWVVFDLRSTSVLATIAANTVVWITQETSFSILANVPFHLAYVKTYLRIKPSESRERTNSSGKYRHSLQLTILR